MIKKKTRPGRLSARDTVHLIAHFVQNTIRHHGVCRCGAWTMYSMPRSLAACFSVNALSHFGFYSDRSLGPRKEIFTCYKASTERAILCAAGNFH